MTNTPPDDADEPQLPPRLAQALGSLNSPRVTVPPEVDTAILAAARRQLHHRRILRPEFRKLAPWLAMAATLALCFAGFQLLRQSGFTQAHSDFDGSGTVDILDAFALARRLEQGPVTDPQSDLNHDGRVDRFDVALAARRAVQL